MKKSTKVMSEFVNKMKQLGHRVNISHYRRGTDVFGEINVCMPKEFLSEVYARGGYSIMKVKLSDGRFFKVHSKCSLSDNWSAHVVHKILLDRITPVLVANGVNVNG